MKVISQVQHRDVRDPRTCAVIGAAIEVHNRLGCGFLEPVYQEALAIEFEKRRVPFRAEVDIEFACEGRPLKTSYRADFICYTSVIVELKALRRIGGAEEAQMLNYLKATGLEGGVATQPRCRFS